jgi:hypothetical protein
MSYDSTASLSPGRNKLNSPSKVTRHVDYVNGLIQRDRIQGSFINRPVLNLNRPELNLDHRVYLAWSPTSRKNNLTTSKMLRNEDSKRRNVFNKYNRLNEVLKNELANDKDSLEFFQKGKYQFNY